MVLGAQREATRGFTRAVAAPFVWLRVPPDLITVSSLGLASAAAYMLWQGEWAWAFLWGMATGFSDFVDGAVARSRGRTTRFGAILDSTVDRYVDGILLLGFGLAIATTTGWLWVGAAWLGSFGTSYVRARTLEAVGQAPAGTWGQWFERPERMLLLALGLSVQWWAQVTGRHWDALVPTIAVLAVASNATALRRLWIARRLVADVETRP